MSSATFRLIGDSLDPDEITRLVGITPTKTTRKGTPIPTRRHPHLTERANVWIVSESASGVSLPEQVEKVLLQLETARVDLRALSSQFAGTFWCLLDMKDEEKGPTVLELSADQVARIAAIGAQLWIEVMDYRD